MLALGLLGMDSYRQYTLNLMMGVDNNIATARYTCYHWLMKLLNRKIEHPGIAFCVIFVVAAVLAKYGVTDGAALLFSLFASIAIYKMLTA